MTVLLVLLLISCVIGCGHFLSSRNKAIRNTGMVLAALGTIFCVAVGYHLGGIVGGIIGLIIMLSVIGNGIQENNKLQATEYLANKNKDYKEQKKHQ